MRITTNAYFKAYQSALPADFVSRFNAIDFSDKSVDLGYRIKASAVFSSNIEGNSVDLNAFMNSLLGRRDVKPRKEIQEIEDLIAAYNFAMTNPLTEANLLQVHAILGKNLLVDFRQGVYRDDRMGVFDANGLVYLAIEPQFVAEKMAALFADIQILLEQDLSLEQCFYHASLIHLKFVHIHPFWDGNGRAARLLEKWFLAQKINSRAWKTQSERYYKEHISDYYQSINLGVNYYELDYSKCLDFLGLLAKAVIK